MVFGMGEGAARRARGCSDRAGASRMFVARSAVVGGTGSQPKRTPGVVLEAPPKPLPAPPDNRGQLAPFQIF
jgi:hypothetical protein